MKTYIKFEQIDLKSSNEYNEAWLRDRIIEDPSILGLEEVIVKEVEKVQPTKGRLDLLLYDAEANMRYEVEIQLGKTDESHIIRTIEYWDIERKRNPQYEHCAVIIAEDITSRFLNVISLFNGHIPLIAIQVKAVAVESNISLVFTRVLDTVKLEIDEADLEKEVTNREYWVNLSNIEMLQFCDRLLGLVTDIEPGFDLKYNKHYIGIAKQGIARNFVNFVPKRKFVIISVKHPKNPELDNMFQDSGLDMLSYDRTFNNYRFRLRPNDLETYVITLQEAFKRAHREYNS